MKFFSSLIAFLLALSLLAAAVAGAYYGAIFVWQFYMELTFSVRLVLVTSVVALLIATFGVAGAITSAGVSVQNRQMGTDKLNLYRALIDYYRMRIVWTGAAAEPVDMPETRQINALRTDILLLADKRVLDTCTKLDNEMELAERSEQDLAALFEHLIQQIRNDLGHKQTGASSRYGLLMQIDDNLQSTDSRSAQRVDLGDVRAT